MNNLVKKIRSFFEDKLFSTEDLDFAETEDEFVPEDNDGIFSSPKAQVVFSVLIVLLISALPMTIVWSTNASNITPLEGIWPIVVSVLIGAIIYAATWFATKKNSILTGFVGAIVAFSVLSFGAFATIADRILPFVPNKFAAIGVAVIAAGVLIKVAVSLSRKEIAAKISFIFVVTLSVLFFFNIVSIIEPATARVRNYDDYIEIQSPSNVPQKQTVSMEKAHPNLYFFVMDECGDFYTMDKYYEMPTSENPFYQYLMDKGFNVSHDSGSYTNLSVYSTANALSLNYVCDNNTTGREARIMAFTGKWFDCLHQMGYNCYQVSSHISHYMQLEELTQPSFLESMLCAVTEDGETVMDMMLDNSILSVLKSEDVTFFDKIGAYILKARLDRVAAFFADPSNYTYEAPMAIHTYLLPPHTPFFCDAEGNTISTSHRCDWVDTKYYKDQYLYTVKYLSGILDNIIANDPSAVIIVQSDHGVRGGLFTAESYEIEPVDQCRILNAVYMGGEILEIEGLSSVNTLRKVLSAEGQDLPPVQDTEEYIYE